MPKAEPYTYLLGETMLDEEDFQKAIDLTNGGYAPSQFALAMILCEKQEFQQAERLIQNGLTMDPDSTVGKYFLGVVQFAPNRRGKQRKAPEQLSGRTRIKWKPTFYWPKFTSGTTSRMPSWLELRRISNLILTALY